MNIGLTYATRLTNRVIELLSPVCERIETAGDVRRQKEPVHKLVLVLTPRRNNVQVSLFDYVLQPDATYLQAVDQWVKIKGEASDTYLERWLPGAYTLCIHVADEDNFGLKMALATGNFAFNQTMKEKWARKKLTTAGGYMRKKKSGELIPIPQEEDLFALLKMRYVEPIYRNQELTDEQRRTLHGESRWGRTG
jgi:DNA polymerase/3'-5' exonuclease PolX